jgi:hypothetical protein
MSRSFSPLSGTRIGTFMAALAIMALLVAACGGTSSESTTSSSPATTAPATTVALPPDATIDDTYVAGEFALVATEEISEMAETGCVEDRVPSADETLCLRIGSRAVTASMVQEGELLNNGTDYSVLLTLTSKGASQYNAIATSCVNVDDRCAGGTVAAVWNGVAVGGAQVRAAAFDQISVSGLGQAAAQALLNAVNAS